MSDNFEQQVKHMLDEVRLEPQQEVWQNVRHAIRPGKTKRRFIFWWLLPVALTAGGLIYFLNNNNETKQIAEKGTLRSQEITVKHPVPSNNNVNDPENKTGNNAAQKINDRIENILTVQVNSAGIKKQKNRTNTIVYGQPGSRAKKEITKENETPVTGPPALSEQSEQPQITQPSSDNVNGDTASMKDLSKSKEKTKDALTTIVLADSNKTPENLPVKKIQPRRSGWSFGITADAGVTTVTDGGILSFGKKSLMDAAFSSPTGPASGIANIVYQNNTASAKASFGIYFTVHREISKQVSFQSSLGVRHQSFSITSSTVKDSFVTGNFVSYPVSRTSSRYNLNSLNLYTGLSFKIVQVNELKLSLGAGIDNQVLLTGIQHKKDESLLYNPAASEAKDNSMSGYNRWQPLIRLQVVADVNAHKKKWLQLSPYFNYGLRKFEKNAISAKDHLASFGLTATYFFR